jgi:hypothetical protein
MMQTTDLRELNDLAHFGRVDLSRLRAVTIQRQVRSRLVVVRKVIAKDALEMPLVQHNDMVEAVAAYGADKALDVRICQTHGRADGLLRVLQ